MVEGYVRKGISSGMRAYDYRRSVPTITNTDIARNNGFVQERDNEGHLTMVKRTEKTVEVWLDSAGNEVPTERLSEFRYLNGEYVKTKRVRVTEYTARKGTVAGKDYLAEIEKKHGAYAFSKTYKRGENTYLNVQAAGHLRGVLKVGIGYRQDVVQRLRKEVRTVPDTVKRLPIIEKRLSVYAACEYTNGGLTGGGRRGHVKAKILFIVPVTFVPAYLDELIRRIAARIDYVFSEEFGLAGVDNSWRQELRNELERMG